MGFVASAASNATAIDPEKDNLSSASKDPNTESTTPTIATSQVCDSHFITVLVDIENWSSIYFLYLFSQ